MENKLFFINGVNGSYFCPAVTVLAGQWPKTSLVDLWGQSSKSKECYNSGKKQNPNKQ